MANRCQRILVIALLLAGLIWIVPVTGQIRGPGFGRKWPWLRKPFVGDSFCRRAPWCSRGALE